MFLCLALNNPFILNIMLCKKFIICFIFLLCVTRIQLSYLNDENTLFATKTPYRFIANNNATEIFYEGCEPIKLWMLIRHGTRNPNAKLIANMLQVLPKLRDEIIKNNEAPRSYLTNLDLEAFRTWQCQLEVSEEKLLVHEGEQEMLELAERMQIRFPNLLPPIYSNTSIKFKYTATQRTEESAKAFATGLFNRKTARDVWFPTPSTKDPILRFYKLCEKWRKEIKKNPNTLSEKTLFDSSVYMRNVGEDVKKRLNISRTLSLKELHVMYMTCAFETAWNKNKHSPWCIPFTKESLKVREFSEDLRYYWVDGYGHELTYKQACPAFGDMTQFFRRTEVTPKSVVYFTHSGTLLKVLAHLGLYKDEKPLKHTDFKKKNRLWHVSKIDPFGANLAFVLFRCNNNDKITNKVAIFHNEQIINTPACVNSDLCDIDVFLNYYKESLDSCNFVDICK